MIDNQLISVKEISLIVPGHKRQRREAIRISPFALSPIAIKPLTLKVEPRLSTRHIHVGSL